MIPLVSSQFVPGFTARLITTSVLALVLAILISPSALAQSQALNGQIEGTVTDSTGAVVANASLTVTNLETGTVRTVTSDESGVYRVPLLPLGSYRIVVEAPNFKQLVREGITLSAGQTVTVGIALEVGNISEQVVVTSDAPIADAGKIDVGRTMTTTEVHNLPLVSRNPYNFALLQSNVTGKPNVEFGVPRINANGYARRANYQLDGNNNTQSDRSGIRLMPISEIFVNEVQLVTNGFAPEFGNTPGIIMNTITPSGTNEFHGNVSYRFRRTAFSARPFFFNPLAKKPGTKVDDISFGVGGRIIKDRWHFYTGFERVPRDLSGEPQRIITISDANRAALIAAGVSAEAIPGGIPAAQKGKFFIVRSDAQLTAAHRLVGRYNMFRNISPDNIAGGITTLERSIDFVDKADSVGLQLVSTLSPNLLNEARYQYSKRYSQNLPNSHSGKGLTIAISGVANFGAPEIANTIQPLEVSNQLLDNVTFTHGNHTMKFGAGFNVIHSTQKTGVFARYTFSSIANYVAAKNGTNPKAYTSYTETLGDPQLVYGSTFYQAFAQDDWKVTERLKVNYGVRYDLYAIPKADPKSPLPFSQSFKVDKNNFAPRLGIVYGLRQGDRPTIVRFSAGLYYDQPQTDLYRRAILSNGTGRFLTLTVNPTSTGAPNFPTALGALPAGAALPRQSIEAVAPDFNSLYAIHTNGQIEQAITNDMSITVGFIQSMGRHIPIYRNINPINPIGTLADGRPIFSTAVNSNTRLYPQFDNVLMAESVGNSHYTAGMVSLNKRLSRGYQFSANYTYSHAIDDAPEQNLVAATSFALSDPTDRTRDRGNSFADQRHTFVMSFVGRPDFKLENHFVERLVNDNQIGVIFTANSGEVFNITTGSDLNKDGVSGSDRPLFIGRNTGTTPAFYNVDLRYTRFIRFNERFNVEFLAEAINVFNIKSIVSVNSVVGTNANGSLLAPLPNFRNVGPTGSDSRQIQLGVKFNF